MAAVLFEFVNRLAGTRIPQMCRSIPRSGDNAARVWTEYRVSHPSVMPPVCRDRPTPVRIPNPNLLVVGCGKHEPAVGTECGMQYGALVRLPHRPDGLKRGEQTLVGTREEIQRVPVGRRRNRDRARHERNHELGDPTDADIHDLGSCAENRMN